MLQIWAMGRGTTVWRIAPGLYYRMVDEVISRARAAHGPPLLSDFDTKLVRGCSSAGSTTWQLRCNQRSCQLLYL